MMIIVLTMAMIFTCFAKHVKSSDSQSPVAGSVAIHLNADFAAAQELLRVARGRVRSRV